MARNVAGWMREQDKWFHAKMDGEQLFESKRLILESQSNTVKEQLEDLEELIKTYRKKLKKCPISGRSAALEEEIESVVQQLEIPADGRIELSAHTVPMDRVVRMLKLAKTKEDGLWLLTLLEDSKNVDNKPWLTRFVEKEGLSAMAAWLCEDKCLDNKEKTPWGQGGSETQHGVLTDGMLPRLIRILEAINFSLIQNAEQKIMVSKIFVKLTHRIKYHAVEKKRDELKERNKALKDKIKTALPSLLAKDGKKDEKKAPENKGKKDEKSNQKKDAIPKKDGSTKGGAGDSNKDAAAAAGAGGSTSQKKNKVDDLLGVMFGANKKKVSLEGAGSKGQQGAINVIDDVDSPHGKVSKETKETASGRLETKRGTDLEKRGGPGVLGKRPFEEIASAGGQAGAKTRPAPFLETLPTLDSEKKGKEKGKKTKRLSWSDKQWDKKILPSHIYTCINDEKPPVGRTCLKVYEREPKFEDQGLTTGHSVTDARQQENMILQTNLKRGFSMKDDGVTKDDEVESIAGAAVAGAGGGMKSSSSSSSSSSMKSSSSSSSSSSGGGSRAGGGAWGRRSLTIKPTLKWHRPKDMRPILDEGQQPYKFRKEFVPTASKLDEDTRRQRVPFEIHYRENQIPNDPELLHNQLRFPSDQDNVRSIPWDIEEAPAAAPSASLQPSPLVVLQSLQNSFDGPAGGLLAPHESVRGGGGRAMAQQSYHNRANVQYESVPVAAYQAVVIPGDHHRLSAMQQGNQHRAPAWTPAPSMPQVQPMQYSAPIHTPHQHHTLQNQSSWRPPNAQAYPDDRWLGNGPERRNGHFGGHHSNHLPYTSSRHGRPGEEGDGGGGWRGNNERGRHSKQ